MPGKGMDAKRYDTQVDWAKRLRNEWPFYRELFGRHNVSSVLDCACGTGRHAIHFAKNGLHVTGIDIEPEMIEQARANASTEEAEVRFEVAAFSAVARQFPSQKFDAVICVGNSLSQVPDLPAVEDAVRNFAAVCSTGGVVVLHILNYAPMMHKDIVQRPLRVAGGEGRLEFFQKVFIPSAPWVHALMVNIEGTGGKWSSSVSGGRLLPIMPAEIRGIVERAGFERLEMLGDYSGRPFDNRSSQDLILTAVKA